MSNRNKVKTKGWKDRFTRPESNGVIRTSQCLSEDRLAQRELTDANGVGHTRRRAFFQPSHKFPSPTITNGSRHQVESLAGDEQGDGSFLQMFYISFTRP